MTRHQTFDGFLRSEGLDERTIPAFRRVLAQQLSEAISSKRIVMHELDDAGLAQFLNDPDHIPLPMTSMRLVCA
jgi:hypothetical protein